MTAGGEAPHVVLTCWTADPAVAATADAAGVDRVGVDLERRGKRRRQPDAGSWISPHRPTDLRRVAPVLRRAAAFARLDPWGPWTAGQVDDALSAGARVLMLPMVDGADPVARLVDVVAGRGSVVPLVELPAGLDRMADVCTVPGVEEVHVGLNDMARALGLGNRFRLLVDPAMVRACAVAVDQGVRLGVGGIGRAEGPALPVPADLVLASYPRLGATAALLSRSFLAGNVDARSAVAAARARLAWWWHRPARELADAAAALAAAAGRPGLPF